MARYDVYANPIKSEARHTPYLLDLQNDYLEQIETRLVAPLHSLNFYQHHSERIRQVFEIESQTVVLDIAELASLPKTLLKKKIVNLSSEQYKIREALDTIFGAY